MRTPLPLLSLLLLTACQGGGKTSTTTGDRDGDGVADAADCAPDDASASTSSSRFVDADGDGYGAPDSASEVCGEPAGTTLDDTDCDDGAAAVHPGAAEIWYDGADEDCSGGSDFDQDGDGYDRDDECDDLDPTRYPDNSVQEVWYNGVDENCDGNDGDKDGDGWYILGYPYEVPAGYAGRDTDCWDDPADYTAWIPLNDLPDIAPQDVHPEASDRPYDGLDQDCAGGDDFDADQDGFAADDVPDATGSTGPDCDDANPDIRPGADEIWYDGIDEDCDGGPDDDQDHDGYSLGEDCDDVEARVHPGAVEDCATASDDDCDGSLNGASMSNCTLWYPDVDGDGYGSTVGGSACQCEGAGAYTAPTSDDCDDGSVSRHPGAPETCDAADDDCDGTADEGLTLYYVDGDGDGQGSGTGSCTSAGRVASGGDCDDADPNLYTGAPELCDNRRNDCGATGWTLTDEDGVASIEYVGVEVWDDVTAYASGGSDGAPAGIGIAVPATFHWCPGTWYVNISFAAGSGDIAADAPHGAGTAVLDGGGVGRVFAANGPDASLTLTDLTLQNGVATSGGLVSSDSADLTLTDVTLTGGAASAYGGAIAVNDATLTLTDVEVRECTAEGAGGGIYVSGDLVADGVLFTDNEVTGTSSAAAVGGAVATHTTDGLVSINNGLFERNGVVATVSTTAGGGTLALEMSGDGAVVLDAVEVSDSYALSSDLAYGGGVSIATAGTTTAALSNVNVSYSYASGTNLASGGGLYLGAGSTAGISVTGGVWNQNAAYSDGTSQGGGAMYSGAGGTGGLVLDGTEVTEGWTYDSAGLAGSGGGLALFFGGEPGLLSGVHVADCGAETGAGIYAEVGSSSSFYLQDDSLVEGNTGTGVHLYAPSGSSVDGIISSVVRDNSANGVEIGANSGASVALYAYGASGVTAGFLGNAGYGLYSGCGSGYAGTCVANLYVWDLGDATSGDDNGTDVYFFSRVYDGYASDTTLTCAGSRCS